MTAVTRHWQKWSGLYWYLAGIAAWMYLIAAIFTQDGWLK